MIVSNIFASISIAFGFSVIGLLINNMIKRQSYYEVVSNLNFVRNEKANSILGVRVLRYIIVNTFWGKFNPALTIKQGDKESLVRLRLEMTYAEISHLICFVLILLLLPVCYMLKIRPELIIPLFVCNIIFHLYPALLQQYNKRRLDRLIAFKDRA